MRLFGTLLLGLSLLLVRSVAAENPQPPKVEIYRGSPGYLLAPRNALVIGVSNLEEGNGFLSLTSPTHDADAVSKSLEDAGFIVNELVDREPPDFKKGEQWMTNRQSIKKAIYDLAETLRKVGGVGLVYFSGHGLQHNRQMYLVPHDNLIRYERDFEEELIPLRLLYDAFSYANNPLNFIIVDACRDDAWPKPLEKLGEVPAVPPQDDSRVILAFATLNGKKAGDTINGQDVGPFAGAFVSSIAPNERQSDLFAEITVKMQSIQASLPDGQAPTINSTPGHEFIFIPTQKEFNVEESIFQNAMSAKDKKDSNPEHGIDLLRKLKLAYGGGYFYQAATEQIEHWPMEPIPLPPLTSEAIPLSPSTSASIEKSADRNTWTSRTIDLGFMLDPKPGVERLDDKSKGEIAGLKGEPLMAKFKVIGYRYQGHRDLPGDPLRLLMRQAGVVEALSAAGYASSSITLSVSDTENAVSDDKVTLEIGHPGTGPEQ
jgi:hypothetical protein